MATEGYRGNTKQQRCLHIKYQYQKYTDLQYVVNNWNLRKQMQRPMTNDDKHTVLLTLTEKICLHNYSSRTKPTAEIHTIANKTIN